MASDKTIQFVALCSRFLEIIRYATRPFPTTVSRDRNAPGTRNHNGYGKDSMRGKQDFSPEYYATRLCISFLTAHVFSDQNWARINVTKRFVQQWEACQLLPPRNCSPDIRTFPHACTHWQLCCVSLHNHGNYSELSHPQLKLGFFFALKTALRNTDQLVLIAMFLKCKCESAGHHLHPCNSLDESTECLWIVKLGKKIISYSSIYSLEEAN